MDDRNDGDPICPFCPVSDPDINFVAEHVEICHPEVNTQHGRGGWSSDMLEASPERQCLPSSNGKEECSSNYIECTHGCGETVIDAEITAHLDMHFAERVALEDTSSPRPELPCDLKALTSCPGVKGQAQLNECFLGPSLKNDISRTSLVRAGDSKTAPSGGIKRLGRTELGPHAHEKQMPSWLRRMLEKGSKSILTNTIAVDGTLRRREVAENETRDVIPVLARLCEQDKSVQRAFFCSPKVHQISKIPKEGGFCGYRNIQMLITFINETRMPGHERFHGDLPTIFQLQDMIENAWDKGFNSVGRVETGGIRGTRKYIGTPEAQALFSSLRIQCEANSIGATKDMRAHDALFMNVAAYFRDACSLEGNNKVIQTSLPPIYFQHEGHSLTIVGFEIRDNGSADILVFDPMFRTPPAVKRLKGAQTLTSDPARILKGYRRGTAYLQKYKIFELLKLKDPANLPEQ
ncbi:DUF1671-domain-containing protein [Aspergillus sclerotioniger CBS 115572]|uniref:DUF1671-domain-containing protein n=1 Tax=Aspergillus sclerotioniger CBS 115572 TaxID=1450535 RepID=A0A317WJ39_9EURO|nr:DUF1671-domain-containing protein [Aspergillus sclerotioniger CBS 115572]PWY85661.1 DUF1671-domain-containing protein [Aspergillus sclerotioniger CBS 115572]